MSKLAQGPNIAPESAPQPNLDNTLLTLRRTIPAASNLFKLDRMNPLGQVLGRKTKIAKGGVVQASVPRAETRHGSLRLPMHLAQKHCEL